MSEVLSYLLSTTLTLQHKPLAPGSGLLKPEWLPSHHVSSFCAGRWGGTNSPSRLHTVAVCARGLGRAACGVRRYLPLAHREPLQIKELLQQLPPVPYFLTHLVPNPSPQGRTMLLRWKCCEVFLIAVVFYMLLEIRRFITHSCPEMSQDTLKSKHTIYECVRSVYVTISRGVIVHMD